MLLEDVVVGPACVISPPLSTTAVGVVNVRSHPPNRKTPPLVTTREAADSAWVMLHTPPPIMTLSIAIGVPNGDQDALLVQFSPSPIHVFVRAVAGSVGRHLLTYSRRVVVENGGDIFLKTDGPAIAGLFAGSSPLSMKMGIRLANTGEGLGVCTSSGTVGHSLSMGKADAVCVIAQSCALADAAATAIGNRIRSAREIKAGIAFGQTIADVMGIVVVVGSEVGAWGSVELVPLRGKKG